MQVEITALKAHPRNYNRHPAAQVGKIKRSLELFGQRKPITTWRGMVLTGHGVFEAARALGWSEIWAEPCPEEWTEDQALAWLAADNELARGADPDEDALAAIVASLANVDAELAALAAGTEERLRELLASVAEPAGDDPGAQVDKAAELQAKWGTTTGQLWQLGEHRLICGDCTDAAVVARVMDGERAQTLVFDPEWDAMPEAMIGFDSVLAFCDGATMGDVVSRFGAPAWVFAWDCVTSWYTPNRPLRRMKLCAWYGDVTRYQFDGWHYGDAGDVRTVANTRGEYQFVPDPRGKHLSDLFQQPITVAHSDGLHNHSKPVDWVTLLIANCTVGHVFDPYSGSGTSMVACHRLERRCFAAEIEPKFVAVTLQRWADMTATEPVLL